MPSDIDIILPDDLESLSETRYQKVLVEIAGYCGYTVWYHTRFSMYSKPGFPDLALFNPTEGGSVYLEVKDQSKGRFSTEQKQWLQDMRASGIHAYGVRPSDVRLVIDVFRGVYPVPKIGSGRPHDALIPICPVPAEGFPWQ